jgi:hypothetical protein
MSTEQRQNEAQQRYDRLCVAYARVFGQEGRRNEDQELVMADMEQRGYLHRSTMVPVGDGTIDPPKMECAEGMRIFVLNTRHLIRSAKASEKKQPVTVRKK